MNATKHIIPELKGRGSEILIRFCKEIIRPYEEAIIELWWDGR